MSDRLFCLPDVGEGLTEGEVLRWLVKVGDVVTVNQPIVEVETAKAAVELPSPFEGQITSIHAAEGDVLAVGAVLVTIRDGVEVESPPEPATGTKAEPVLVGYGVAEASTRRRRRVVAPSPHGTDRP